MLPSPIRAAGLGVLLGALSLPLSAQTVLPFPLLPAGTDGPSALARLVPDDLALRELTGLESVVLQGARLGDDQLVDLALERIDLAPLQFGYQVDGAPAPDLAAGLDLSVWSGRVLGEPGSEVVLGFSNRGSHGWVRSGGETVHLLGQPGAGNDWAASSVLLARDDELAERGLALADYCDADQLPRGLQGDAAPTGSQPVDESAYAGGSACSGWVCPIAIETDFQYFQVFGNLGAETAFLTTLLAAVSDRYVEQIDTLLTYPYVQFYTSSNDPWSTPDFPGGSIDMLTEFEQAWAGSVPGGAVLGHFVSGADLGGGVAYLGALCDTSQTFSFAVSGNNSGQVPFPIVVSPLNWDFMVFAHETGHNFNSPHTHDYSPQIDNCVGDVCINDGTIMSYCHLCPGGLSNITTYFHEPTVVNVMMAHASSCLDTLEPLIASPATQPTLVAPGAPTELSVVLAGSAVSGVDLSYRLAGGSFTTIAMSDQGGGVWSADLPSPACGDTPEWFFSVTDAECGFFQTQTFGAEVGVATVVVAYDMEANDGWSVGAAGDDASTGVWERGDPVGTAAQPEDAAAGSDCWFTGQGNPGGGLGDNDVDGGKTTLVSPAIDLSGGDAVISYQRWYSNDTSAAPNTDIFEVEISNGGSWVDVETVGPAGPGTSGGWIYHEFTVSDFVTPNANVQVRFIASDEGDGSLVEAAVDEFNVFRVDCSGGTVCQADIGFGGPGSGSLSICGDALASGGSADLAVSGATPGGTAFVFAGLVNGATPVKGGVLVPVPWVLQLALPLDGSGELGFPIPGGNGPLTVYTQVVYTDPGQALGYGFTNAVQAEFLP